MLITCLLAAAAMGLWHTVEFYEKEKVVGDEFYQQWTGVLRDNTRISYDWSYVLAWAGVACSLVAAILLSCAAICLRSEREKEEHLNLQYLMPGKSRRNRSTAAEKLMFSSFRVHSLSAEAATIPVWRISAAADVSGSQHVPRIPVRPVQLLSEGCELREQRMRGDIDKLFISTFEIDAIILDSERNEIFMKYFFN